MENWKSAGACVGKDQSLFFPEHNKADWQAKVICSTCIVKAQCLDVALRGEESGVWGGTNERERKRILRRYYRGSKTEYEDLASPVQVM